MLRRIVDLLCGSSRSCEKSRRRPISPKPSRAECGGTRRELPCFNQGFSLIELLAVIGLIAVLAVLLLVVLNHAKSSTHWLACLNNVKQIQLAWMLYAEDNNESLVPNAGLVVPALNFGRPWVASGDYDQPNNPECTNVLYLVNPYYAAFATYVRAPAVYRCPADRSTVSIGGRIHPRSRSYTLNNWLGISPFQIVPEAMSSAAKLTDIVNPGPLKRLAFMDTHPGWIYDVFFVPPMPRWTASSELFNSFPAAHHYGAACLSFADGHAEKHRWLDARTKIPESVRTDDGAYPQPSQLGNPDVRWLEERGPTHAR